MVDVKPAVLRRIEVPLTLRLDRLVIGDTGEHVGKPSLAINVVELAGLNQRESPRHARRRDPKTAHNARIPAQEITVTYPFHPLTGQTFVLAGRYEHGSVEHLLVRRKDQQVTDTA